VRFRRRSGEGGSDEGFGLDDESTPGAEPVGPFDADELPEDGPERVDLGSLLIAPTAGRELRLQVDEASGAVQSVVLAGPDGAVELRAFAAPRGGDLWSEARPQIAAELTQAGGTATEREGPFGPELHCQMTVARSGGSGVQASRVVGINGPRWMLRATLLGRPATEPQLAPEWEETIRGVAVRRGQVAMPVGEALPLSMPPDARRVEQ
jgi:hypothetical protein